jgi:hypothetical protein
MIDYKKITSEYLYDPYRFEIFSGHVAYLLKHSIMNDPKDNFLILTFFKLQSASLLHEIHLYPSIHIDEP